MANRVNVDVHVRDLTRTELMRLRRGFDNLGRDLDRTVAQRGRQSFERLSQTVTQARRNLALLRGAIPEAEFYRLDDAIRRSERSLRQGLRSGQINLQAIARDVQDVEQSFRRLDRSGRIRVEVDRRSLDRSLGGGGDSTIGRRIGQRLVRGMTSPFRQFSAFVGGILQDGIGQGIIGAFKQAGPIGAAILVAAIAAVASVIGAALSGLIVTALGLAFVGVAGVSAAMSDEVKKEWEGTLASLKENFREVGEPMIPVLTRALGIIEEMADRAAPAFRKAIEDTVPATNKFIDGLLGGFKEFGKEAFKPIMDAWNVFAPVFAEQWQEFMRELGDAFGDMAKLVQEHPTEIADALAIVFEAIELLIRTVTALGEAWVFMEGLAGDALGFVLQSFAELVNGVLTGVSSMLHSLAFLAKAIPGVGDKAQKAAEDFDRWRESAVEDFRDMADKAYGFDEALNQLNRKRRLEADISSWEQQLSRARDSLKKTTDQKAKAKLDAEIGALQAKIRQAQAELNKIDGRVTRTTAVLTTVNRQVFERVESSSRPIFRAHGGLMGARAAATGGVRGNLTMVGEQGPELVNLPAGSHVRSNPDTKRLLAQQAAGAGGMGAVELSSAGGAAADLIIELLRTGVKSRGGNVQLAVMGRE